MLLLIQKDKVNFNFHKDNSWKLNAKLSDCFAALFTLYSLESNFRSTALGLNWDTLISACKGKILPAIALLPQKFSLQRSIIFPSSALPVLLSLTCALFTVAKKEMFAELLIRSAAKKELIRRGDLRSFSGKENVVLFTLMNLRPPTVLHQSP